MTKERTNARIVEKYKKQDPAALTRQEYDEICTSLDNAAAQHMPARPTTPASSTPVALWAGAAPAAAATACAPLVICPLIS